MASKRMQWTISINRHKRFLCISVTENNNLSVSLGLCEDAWSIQPLIWNALWGWIVRNGCLTNMTPQNGNRLWARLLTAWSRSMGRKTKFSFTSCVKSTGCLVCVWLCTVCECFCVCTYVLYLLCIPSCCQTMFDNLNLYFHFSFSDICQRSMSLMRDRSKVSKHERSQTSEAFYKHEKYEKTKSNQNEEGMESELVSLWSHTIKFLSRRHEFQQMLQQFNPL